MNRAALQAAYATARYRIDCGGQAIERRVGVVDLGADRLLSAAGCRTHWHILTSCNPASRRLPPAENAARLDALRHDLQRHGWPMLPSVNSDGDDAWIEPGFCVLDAAAADVRALAMRHGQSAIVAGRLGQAPLLVWI